MIKRGEVVSVDFPYTDQRQSKLRPAVVILNDCDNQRLHKTVVAMVTGNLKRAGDPSHVLVDPGSPKGAGSGLQFVSLVSCNNLYTIEQSHIVRQLGRLSPALLQELNQCVRHALELP
jgi:mRNA interferase MazF